MAVTAPIGFMSANLTASGATIYSLCVAYDGTVNWPRTCRSMQIIVTGVVNMRDTTHSSGTASPLPASVLLPFGGSGVYQNVYVDQMYVSGGGTFTVFFSE